MNTDNTMQDEILFDDEANAAAALREKLTDTLVPGFQVEFDPDEATLAGAFVEDALSEQDAVESNLGLDDATAMMAEGTNHKEG